MSVCVCVRACVRVYVLEIEKQKGSEEIYRVSVCACVCASVCVRAYVCASEEIYRACVCMCVCMRTCV